MPTHRVLLSALLGALLLAAGCRSATENPGHRGRVRVAAASDLNAALSVDGSKADGNAALQAKIKQKIEARTEAGEIDADGLELAVIDR